MENALYLKQNARTVTHELWFMFMVLQLILHQFLWLNLRQFAQVTQALVS